MLVNFIDEFQDINLFMPSPSDTILGLHNYQEANIYWAKLLLMLPNNQEENCDILIQNESLVFLAKILNIEKKSAIFAEDFCLEAADLIENLQLKFVNILAIWFEQNLANIRKNPDNLVNFAGMIRALPWGDPDINLEISIACCQLILPIYEEQGLLQKWAVCHQNLALTYEERSIGDIVENTRRSYFHYYQAKKIFPTQVFPQIWKNFELGGVIQL